MTSDTAPLDRAQPGQTSTANNASSSSASTSHRSRPQYLGGYPGQPRSPEDSIFPSSLAAATTLADPPSSGHSLSRQHLLNHGYGGFGIREGGHEGAGYAEAARHFVAPHHKPGMGHSDHIGIDPLQADDDNSEIVPYDFPGEQSPPTFDGPSSAPPTPSVISVTHPPHFIHTHHPRRGSLTPLGLNVISPMPPLGIPADGTAGSPTPGLSSSLVRTIGFAAAAEGTFSMEATRRDSVATVGSSTSKTSTASNLTATRPGYAASLASSGGYYRRSSLTPSVSSLGQQQGSSSSCSNHGGRQNSTATVTGIAASFDPAKRRSSLTPTLPTLSAPSPTRALVAGKIAAATRNADNTPPFVNASNSTADLVGTSRRSSAAAALTDSRRGSLPQMYYGAWTSSGERISRDGSGDSTLPGGATIQRGFKFGSIGSTDPPDVGIDSASSSLQRIAQVTSARKADGTVVSSAFELAEQQEADRQRRAFLAATYGEDSRRARARLSLGGNSTTTASPASTRRQSLLLWERIKGGSGESSISGNSVGHDRRDTSASIDDLAGLRRPSLPTNIPRTPKTDHATFEDQSVWDRPEDLPDFENDEGTPQRPLPPLLPLSDPVPRLLPSTLALHRASHLLSSRNLASEPLPAPLPVSLHPPQPVDLSEFDIDFILAGSKPNLGRSESKGSNRRSGNSSSDGHGRPPLEEEDSFAKFVGKFDDEYGDRRGDWTFRAVPRMPQPPGAEARDPQRPVPRCEWESHGAGKYELYSNGDVRSVVSGSVWRLKQTSSREFELEQPLPGLSPFLPSSVEKAPDNGQQPVVLSPCRGYTLTSKLNHTEEGGVKLPLPVQRELASRRSRMSRRFAAAARNRQSITESLFEVEERAKRLNSQDSGATALPIAAGGRLNAAMSPGTSNLTTPDPSPPKDEPRSHSTSVPIGIGGRRNSRGKRDADDEKQKKGFSGVLKRGLSKASSMLEDRKERGQFWANGHGLGQSFKQNASWAGQQAQPPPPLRPPHSDRSDSASASSQHSSKYTSESTEDWPTDELFGSLGLGIEDEQNGGLPWKEGKAWEVVPDDALAMIIPIESEKQPPLPHTPAATKAFINPFFVDGPRQALLVWFTPFNSASSNERERERERERDYSGSTTLFNITESPLHETEGGPLTPSRPARLPKLWRPRGSRADLSHRSSGLLDAKHIPIPPPTSTPPTDEDGSGGRSSSRASHNLIPLPFRSFRVVAKIVDTEALRSQPEVPVIALEQWTEQMRTGKPAGVHTPPLDTQSRVDSGGGSSEVAESSRSPSLTDNEQSLKSGRSFPTVIAVCHSPTSGVEFVLEGLDRLGLCRGESAWGPTGYEEWRGTGLSDTGRQMLDLLWAATAAVMGI